MASRSSTVIISSAPIAKVGRLLTLTIAEINGTWLPFSFADGPLAPKYDSHHLETGPRIWLSPGEVLAPFYITQNIKAPTLLSASRVPFLLPLIRRCGCWG